jgi:hypothetical protein
MQSNLFLCFIALMYEKEFLSSFWVVSDIADA